MDQITPLLQSGNIWAVMAGIILTLAIQWAKNRVSPPTPTPAPDPNAPAPAKPTFLQSLLAFLEQLALSKAKADAPTAPVATEAPTARQDLDQQAAMHLIGMLGLKADAPPKT